MGKKRSVKGVCHLCGEEKELSFEHVPPRSSYNKTTKYKTINYLDYMEQPDPLNPQIKGKVFQGGTGYHSLCRECNSFLGSSYVGYYKSWVDIGFQILSHGNQFLYGYDVFKLEPLKIIKHIISMFLSINNESFLESFPELSEFVKNPESTELPEKFQLFTYLNNEGDFRNISFMVHSNLNTSQIVSCSEMSFPPYGYVLTFNSTKDIKFLKNITYFKDYSHGEVVDIQMEMFRLPTYLQVPLDYRNKEVIETDIERNKKLRKQ